MKGIWRGESDPLMLIEGKTYEILDTCWDGTAYLVKDETGEDFLYPVEEFDIVEEEKTA